MGGKCSTRHGESEYSNDNVFIDDSIDKIKEIIEQMFNPKNPLC